MVVGDDTGKWGWNSTPNEDPEAQFTAEIFDPRTGQFSLTARIPMHGTAFPSSRHTACMATGSTASGRSSLSLTAELARSGRMPLAGGGSSRGRRGEHAIAPLEPGDERVDPDRCYGQRRSIHNRDASTRRKRRGPDRRASRPPPGRAGSRGRRRDVGTGVVTDSSELYDPASDTWSPLPPLPQPRASGSVATLDDGSVLIVGGHDGTDAFVSGCESGPTGLATAVRFVPQP